MMSKKKFTRGRGADIKIDIMLSRIYQAYHALNRVKQTGDPLKDAEKKHFFNLNHYFAPDKIQEKIKASIYKSLVNEGQRDKNLPTMDDIIKIGILDVADSYGLNNLKDFMVYCQKQMPEYPIRFSVAELKNI